MGIPHTSKYAIACRRPGTRVLYLRDRPHRVVSTLAIELQLTGRFHAPIGSAFTKSTRADSAWIVVSAPLLRKPKRAFIDHKYARMSIMTCNSVNKF